MMQEFLHPFFTLSSTALHFHFFNLHALLHVFVSLLLFSVCDKRSNRYDLAYVQQDIGTTADYFLASRDTPVQHQARKSGTC